MKQCYFFIFLFILLLLSGCLKQQNTTINEQQAELTVHIELVKEYFVNDSILWLDPPEYIKNKRFDIQITLENNSDTAIAFVKMTCSWKESFLINTPYIEYVDTECNSNYPQKVNVEAHEKYVLNTTLEQSKNHVTSSSSGTVMTKLGFIYVPSIGDSVRDYLSIMEDKSRWHIIWSNPLLLSKR